MSKGVKYGTNKKTDSSRGSLLIDVIRPLGMTITEAAFKLGVTRKALCELVHGKISLSSDMAVRIAKSTGTSAES